MWRRSNTLRFLPIFILFLGAIAIARLPASTEVTSQDGRTGKGLECTVFCSETKLRTSVAEITWPSSEESLSRQVLEVTVYKNGFTRGTYATLAPVQRGQKFSLQRIGDRREHVRGLERLVITDVYFSKKRGGLAVVRVEGLEPGLNYFWRLRSGAGDGAPALTRCQATECPADMEKEH